MKNSKSIIGDWSFMGKIGAKPSDKPFAPVPAIKTSEATKKLIDGKAISIDEIPDDWKTGEVFLDERSLPFVLYISDQTIAHLFGFRRRYKFHFKWCRTLASMKKQNREKRYRAKYDICNPSFEINDRKSKEKLKVCLNCCNELRAVYSYFEANNSNIEKKFSMPKFFEKFGVINLPSSTHPGGKDSYTRDWRKVATREKEKADWQCKDPKCKTPQKSYRQNKQNLDVHHINGVKSDNASDNLEVVCRECHANKWGHEHMRL